VGVILDTNSSFISGLFEANIYPTCTAKQTDDLVVYSKITCWAGNRDIGYARVIVDVSHLMLGYYGPLAR